MGSCPWQSPGPPDHHCPARLSSGSAKVPSGPKPLLISVLLFRKRNSYFFFQTLPHLCSEDATFPMFWNPLGWKVPLLLFLFLLRAEMRSKQGWKWTGLDFMHPAQKQLVSLQIKSHSAQLASLNLETKSCPGEILVAELCAVPPGFTGPWLTDKGAGGLSVFHESFFSEFTQWPH